MKEKQKTFELEPVQQLLPADAQQRVMDQLYQFMELEHLYESAIREVKTKLEILDSEFKTKYDHNPIHHLEDCLLYTSSNAAIKPSQTAH